MIERLHSGGDFHSRYVTYGSITAGDLPLSKDRFHPVADFDCLAFSKFKDATTEAQSPAKTTSHAAKPPTLA